MVLGGLVRVFLNGRVYVSLRPRRTVEAMVVVGGRVVFTGDSRRAREIGERLGGEEIDLGGRTVLPGFIDPHVHIDGIGQALNTLDLRGVSSIEELKRLLREFAERTRTRWVLGRGWDQELFREKRWPTRWDLDEVVRDRPVLLTRVCGHAGVVNSLALSLSGLEEVYSPDIVRDERGVATGVVRENALSIVRERAREDLSDEDFEKFFLDAMRHAASLGVTTLGFVSCDSRSLATLLRIRGRGPLPVRVRVYLSPGRDPHGRDTSLLDMAKRIGLYRGFGDEYLKILGFKIIADGSLGARTAWLSEPYSDDPSTAGYPTIDREALAHIAGEVDKMGLQLAIHAIGDRALDMVLDIYQRLGDVYIKRHRIEHVSVVRDDQLTRIRGLRPALVVQPHFVISDWWAGQRLGPGRTRWLYRFRDLIDTGAPVALSTDAPVEPLSPWETVYAAVSRGLYENIPYYEETRDQVLSLEEALYHYTEGAAYILGEEGLYGALREGMYADFIVVDRDPFETDTRGLREIRVLETYVGGERVYRR